MTVHDVVVIGGGFSGLGAARRLTDAGLDVVVLEALSMVGGRTRTVRAAGTWLELGGQWASPEHAELLQLASEFGVGTFSTPTDGGALLVEDGVVSDLEASPGAAALVEAVAQIDRLAAEVPLGSPWTGPGASAQDALTFDAWAAREITDEQARRKVVRIVEELMTTPAREMSLLSVLQGARSSGSLAAAIGIEGGAQEIRFDGGLHSIAVHLARDLGKVVRTEWPVTAVHESDGVVHADGPRGAVRARHAVVALAPSQAAGVSFQPALPEARVELQRQMVMGSVIKVNAVYDRPFWREQGLSGLVMDFDGPVTYCVDNSPPDHEVGVLASFFAAGPARHFSSLGPDRRREVFVEQAERWFGPQSRELVYVDQDWTVEAFIGGGYSGIMRPGGWSTAGSALRQPVGRVHWASSESSTEWTGYVEGALRGGRRAAAEILDERA